MLSELAARILLVDDRPENLLALEAVLEGQGYTLVRARSGREAVRRAEQEAFALVVLDVQMPDMDGYETARQLKQSEGAQETPIIFLTALARSEEWLLRAYALGAVDYLTKPFNPQVLRAKVASLVEFWRRGRQLREQHARVQLLQRVALTANGASSGAEALQSCLELVCAHTGWPIGHAFMVAADGVGEAISTSQWHLQDPLRYERFRHASENLRIAPAAGLVGQVLARGRPLWARDVAEELIPVRAQAAVSAGLSVGFAFPILAQEEVVGVLEFFSPLATPSDARLLETMHLVGTQLGRVIERERAEEALQRAAREIEDLYEQAPCGYHSLDANGTFVRVNHTELSWLGYERGEVVGKLRFADVLTPASKQLFQESFPQFLERGWVQNLEFELVRKDGTTFPVLLNATAVRDAAGRFLMSRSTLFDLAERKRAEREFQRYALELEQSNRELHTALEQVRQLQGVLPICGYCKSIRDDRDYWHRLESYISDHTEARFSHGICPPCYQSIVEPQLAELAAHTRATASVDVPSPRTPTDGIQRHVLIVEDDAESRESLAEILQGEDYAVTTAAGGAEALSALRSGPLPCVILLDLVMAGMSGREFRREQQADARLDEIPVILFSGASDIEEQARQLGVAAYLTKPVEVEALLAAVARHSAVAVPE